MTVELLVSVMGLDELQKAFANGDQAVRQELKLAMQAVTFLIERDAKERITQKTRGTARTIHSIVTVEGGVLIGKVGSSSQVADWLEHGTGIYHVPDKHKPWTVVPKGRKALAIPVGGGTTGAMPWMATQNLKGGGYAPAMGRMGGKQQGPAVLYRTPKGTSTANSAQAQSVLLRRSVTIQGMKPRPFLRPAFEAKKDEAKERFRKALEAVRDRLAQKATGGG